MTRQGEEFFARATVDVARDLLGATLRVGDQRGTWTAGRIVETEAYGGQDDPASHAGRGRTPRSAIMFGPAGVAYVYFIYGMHHCLNVVTEVEGRAGAVLIRALEPVAGLAEMVRRRNLDPTRWRPRDLTAGPGKLCQALGLDLTWNGTAVTTSPQRGAAARQIVVETAASPVAWRAGPRIGISRAVEWPHRFVDPKSECLSR